MRDMMWNVLGMVLSLKLGQVSQLSPPTRQPSPSYEVKVEGNNIHTSKRSMITNILDVGYGGREIVTMIMMIPSSKKFKHL